MNWEVPLPTDVLHHIRSIWANINVKPTIRRVLGRRILGLTLDSPQNLKRKIGLSILTVPMMLLMTTGGTQADLGRFGSDETPTPECPPEPEVDDDPEDGDEPETDTDDELPEDDDEEDEPPTGIIYARVSSDKQRSGSDDDNDDDDTNIFDEGSIEGQIEELEDIAEQEGIELPYDPIVDEAESGTDFDRDGIQEVFEKSKRKDIDYLLVEKVDRIGRSAAETIYFIYILQSECNVTLITTRGARDIGETEGLMQATVMSLTAQIQNELRIAKASKERIRGFLKKKNWDCKSRVTPLGYTETDDRWLEVDPSEKPIARDMFKKFAECGTYGATEQYIEEEYGEEYLEGKQIKTLLQDWVYIGKPRLPESWLENTMYENDLHEPDLHLLRDEEDAEIDVSEDIFHQVQDIIEDKEQERSDEDTSDLLDFIEEYSLFAVIQGSDPATLLHHCGEPLVKDGQVDLRGDYTVHRYRCRNCEETENAEDYYRRWPKDYELDKIRLIQQVVDGDEPDFLDTE